MPRGECELGEGWRVMGDAWRYDIELVTGSKPKWFARVPLCDEACPKHDGKRCEILGFDPGNTCEPAVREMGAVIEKASGK